MASSDSEILQSLIQKYTLSETLLPVPPEISALEVELHCDSELELEQLKRQNAQSTQQLR